MSVTKRIFLSVVLVGGLLIAWRLAMSSSSQRASISPDLQQIPGIELGVNSDISAVDFVVDEHETLHVVWAVKPNRTIASKERIFYARGENSGNSWSRPVQLADESTPSVKISARNGEVHVVFGLKLQHMMSRDNGNSWNMLEPLITSNDTSARMFDLAMTPGQLIALYASMSRAGRGIPASSELSVVRWSPNNPSPPRRIVWVEDEIASLRLVRDSERLHAVVSLNAGRKVTKGNVTEYQTVATILYLLSNDDGTTWSSPASVFASARDGSSRNIPSFAKGNIELLPFHGELFVFFHGSRLFMSRSTNGAQWTEPASVTEYETSPLSATYSSRSVSAAAINASARLVWIDSRFRNTDRRWWKPLGGWPWSDQPDWTNNDVFTMPFSQSGTGKTVVEHLTPPLAYADTVRVHASPQRYVILWSGRRKVGKTLDAFNEPPSLFFTRFPAL